MSTTLFSRSIGRSLALGTQRLGADIVVIPEGKEKQTKAALLLGKPVSSSWMPEENLRRIAGVEGVSAVSPQLYLETLTGAACCSAWEMFMVAFDPGTDFTILPWLKERARGPLRAGEVIGGDWISVPEGEKHIRIYGVPVNLAGKLEPTGMGLDQTLFLPQATAREIAGRSNVSAEKPLEIPAGKISAVQVKVKKDQPIDDVARRIMTAVPGTYALASLELTRTIHRETEGLFRVLFLGLALVWIVAVFLSGLVFSLMVNTRRREIGLLRALGASRGFIFKLFFMESATLGLGGGVAGILVALVFVFLFRIYLMRAAAIPMLFPPLWSVIAIMFFGLFVVLILALPAFLYPAVRASRMDPASTLREM
jgi:putative ABC transport system permease protein